MNAKGYLRQIEMMDIEIEQKSAELEELKSRAMSLGAGDGGGARSSGRFDRVSALVSQYIDAERELDAEINKCTKLKQQIISQIRQMGDTRYRKIIYKRYVEYKPLEQIAEEMHFAYGYIRRMHGQALAAFSDKFPKEVT